MGLKHRQEFRSGHTVQYLRVIPSLLCSNSLKFKLQIRTLNTAVSVFYSFFLLKGDLLDFYVLDSTLLHLPPLRFNCVGGCWDRTQDCCDFGIGVRRSDHSSRSHYLEIFLVLMRWRERTTMFWEPAPFPSLNSTAGSLFDFFLFIFAVSQG